MYTTELFFWSAVGLCVYTYAVYPGLLYLYSKLASRPVGKSFIFPGISVIIAARDEEGNITRRLDDLLAQDYPQSHMEILVVSDGSRDRTEEVVKKYAAGNVTIYSLGGGSGKAAALNYGVSQAKGEIIVFTDARQTFKKDAIRQLVANFADPEVGCASGELHLRENSGSQINAEMGGYWRYEKFIRLSESRTGSVVGATGCIYAIRREFYRQNPIGTILDDVLTPLNIARSRKRVVFDSQSVAYDDISANVGQEWLRKVRTLSGNWQLLSAAPWTIVPGRNPIWWRFVSHKVARLLVPYALVAILVSGALTPGRAYLVMSLAQLAAYVAAVIGICFPKTRKIGVINLGSFFLVMNAAAVVGFWKWVTGACATTWKRTNEI